MASSTQIVCLCEGKHGDPAHGSNTSIDLVFVNKLIRTIRPNWVRREGRNWLTLKPCGTRSQVISRMPDELKVCLSRGGDTTLMVWADCDHDCEDAEALKRKFWDEAQQHGITTEQFDGVVFILAKDRLENWIEFLTEGNTDESKEGPRVKHSSEAAKAARRLAAMCSEGVTVNNAPPSLQWSCNNWRALAARFRRS